jgi:hypothetical protein
MSIKLLGGEWEPRLPASFVQRHEIVLSYEQGVDKTNQIRVWAAALGATWNHPDRTKTLDTTLADCGYAPRLYGEKVADELIRAGVSLGEICVHGATAFNAIARSIIPQSEVDDRAGFSSAAGGSSQAAEEVKSA